MNNNHADASNERGQHSALAPLLSFHVLGSGSKGNAAVVSGPHGAILIDAGFSAKELLYRLDYLGIDPDSIEAIVLTHEHSDHTGGLGPIARKLGVGVWATEGTLRSNAFARARVDGERVRAGSEFTLCGITVMPFSTSHDAAEPIGMRFSLGGDSLGYMTDTGIVPGEAYEMLSNVRTLAIESNHDLHMLEVGPYPYHLKQRIRSERGHLSNIQTTEALTRLASDTLETVVAMHLSQTNNDPTISGRVLREHLGGLGHGATVTCAGQGRPKSCEVLQVQEQLDFGTDDANKDAGARARAAASSE